MAVERMETCDDVGELARELGVRPRCLYKWRKKLEMVEAGQESSRPSTHASAHRKEIHRWKLWPSAVLSNSGILLGLAKLAANETLAGAKKQRRN
jgi:transposase-like protein